MMRSFKRIPIILVIAISFYIPIFSAFFGYYNLAEADFLSSTLIYENLDQENLLTDFKHELKVFGPSGISNAFFLITNFFKQFSYYFPQVHSLDQRTFILRC